MNPSVAPAAPTVPVIPAAGIVLAHPTGNEFFRHAVRAFGSAGRLAAVCTCVDGRAGGPLGRFLPRSLSAELKRRSVPEIPGVPVFVHPAREMARLAAGRLGLGRLGRGESAPLSADAVYRDFDRWVASRLKKISGAGIAYAYEDGALETFEAARRLGWRRVYDLPIAYWETGRRLLAEEAERLPAWRETLPGLADSPSKLERKVRELELAEVVVCPSPFVVRSLPSWAASGRRIVLAPFGSPAAALPAGAGGGDEAVARPGRSGAAGARLRVLFAGGLTQRKGLADLFAAMRLLRRSDVELVVMGSPVAPLAFYRRELPDFTYEAPRPHARVLELMAGCDVFCLPSIVEGRALVIQEAMSRGLPAIVTPNTGADDVVEDGKSGYVVPIRSPEALAEKIAWFADHRSEAAGMGAAAREAAARYSWARYGGLLSAGI